MKVTSTAVLILIMIAFFAGITPAHSQVNTEMGSLTDEILPESSILGLKYGSSDKSIVGICGHPTGVLTITNEVLLMVYPRGVDFLLRNGLLAGAVIKPTFLPFGIEWLGSSPETLPVSWKLPNGVSSFSTFGEVVKAFEIGGLGLDPKQVYRYNPGNFSVILTFDRLADHVPEYRKSSLSDFDMEYSVNGLLVGEFAVVDSVFRNGR